MIVEGRHVPSNAGSGKAVFMQPLVDPLLAKRTARHLLLASEGAALPWLQAFLV